MHVHVVVGILPQKYLPNRNGYHNVIRHDHPFFRTMMTRELWWQIKDAILCRHSNNEVKVDEMYGESHIYATVEYSPDHFKTPEAIFSLEEWVGNLMNKARVQSGIVPPDQC